MFLNFTNENQKTDQRNFPYLITGISKTQANVYAQWRTDRVAEWILMQKGFIATIPNQNPENHFTIARYLKGQYSLTIKQKTELILPVYSIPTTIEEELYGDLVKFDYLVPNFKSKLDIAGKPSYAKGFWCIARIQKFIAKD